MTSSSDNFSILTVCTGNICRSPLAEAALREAFADLDEITVESAGTSAPVGAPVPSDFVALAHGLQLSTESHRARALTPEMVRQADLVLALDRSHRRAIVSSSLAPTGPR
ncbi:hypothetical protein GCM10025867_04250 [Frondihabitans sucicola]|uniref:protein-tyrosine-phosphatase n=1 Tax=Frondihabitans sucicola TaxID=1268041 RepID=A0ABM8GIL1_9MICO|nr:hypothetical protein [Frondihabitans sucicola]BDZ48184.1 hypothetical protein GCM10025867_04250 [Frondihabitans sucicola]